MKVLLEKSTYYLIGGIIGAIVGRLGIILEIPFFDPECITIIMTTFFLIGFLSAIALFEYKKDKQNKENDHIKDETIALITHEMRTGLTSTGWAIQLILQKYEDKIEEEDKKMLQGVSNSISTTVMHSMNLLDVSMLDIGKLNISLEWKPLSEIKKLFDETLEKYVYGARKKGIVLNSKVELDQNREVEVDILRLRIIVENLLENALQYTMGSIKEITVEAKTNKNDLEIVIRDTGIGIPKDEQNKIFSKFFRASNARSKLGSGSGIGLYMCQKYISAHKGKLNFESEENKGTTFRISIPLKTIADAEEFLKKI